MRPGAPESVGSKAAPASLRQTCNGVRLKLKWMIIKLKWRAGLAATERERAPVALQDW